jgi:chromosome segregation ATPase
MNNDEKEILGKSGRNYKKIIGSIILFVLFGAICAGITYYFSAQNITQKKDKQIQGVSQEAEKLDSLNKTLEEKFSKLSADYDRIYKDRENIIEQSRRIIQEKNELLNFKKSFEEVTEEKDKLLKDKQQLSEEVGTLKVQMEQTGEKYGKELAEAKEQIKNYQADIVEKDKVNESLIKKTNIQKLETTIKTLEKENGDLNKKLNVIGEERNNLSKQLEQQNQGYAKKELASQSSYNELLNKYEELAAKHGKTVQEQEALQKQLNEFPSKIGNLAAENKRLVKETSDMHYNLGLFYFEKQEYKRAIPEFERAIKISPQDPESYYYLGYIYAEYFMERDKAIEYFNKYLELAPRGTHSDWVKRYIFSWRIWDKKENIE